MSNSKNQNTNLFTYNVGSKFDNELFVEEVIKYGWSMEDMLVSCKDDEWFVTYDRTVLDGDVMVEILVECGLEVEM